MASHICVSHAQQDTIFANQLAIQLQQRGLVVRPLPDPLALGHIDRAAADLAARLATHILVVLSPNALMSDDETNCWKRALRDNKYVIGILYQTCEVPAELQALPLIDFRGKFLLAVEDLVDLLKRQGAPTRQLTHEHPIVNPLLLPSMLPSERCRREDRVRVNYTLPVIFSPRELEHMLPEFFRQTGFERIDAESPAIRARRTARYGLFDPRRADQILIIEPRSGELRVIYQTTRVQVMLWLPAHYHLLDYEAGALYRYLATEGDTITHALQLVHKRARIAQWFSWITLLLIVLFLGTFFALLLDEIGLMNVF